MKPSLTLTLTPSGSLEAILPDGRSLELRVDPLKSIISILTEQLAGNISIGELGSPTRHQIWHQEQHSIFPDSRCVHCLHEGRVRSRSKRNSRIEIISKSKDLTIRKVSQVKKGKKVEVIKMLSLDQL